MQSARRSQPVRRGYAVGMAGEAGTVLGKSRRRYKQPPIRQAQARRITKEIGPGVAKRQKSWRRAATSKPQREASVSSVRQRHQERHKCNCTSTNAPITAEIIRRNSANRNRWAKFAGRRVTKATRRPARLRLSRINQAINARRRPQIEWRSGAGNAIN